MSHSVSQTLRLTAKEAEYYIKRSGDMEVASGSFGVTSSILGLIGLILASDTAAGGVSLSVIKSGSIATDYISKGIELTNGHINPTEESFDKLAKSQMKMVEKQGRFINLFLGEAIEAFDTYSGEMDTKEIEETENYLYLYDMVENEGVNEDTKGVLKQIWDEYGRTVAKGGSAIFKIQRVYKKINLLILLQKLDKSLGKLPITQVSNTLCT